MLFPSSGNTEFEYFMTQTLKAHVFSCMYAYIKVDYLCLILTEAVLGISVLIDSISCLADDLFFFIGNWEKKIRHHLSKTQLLLILLNTVFCFVLSFLLALLLEIGSASTRGFKNMENCLETIGLRSQSVTAVLL